MQIPMIMTPPTTVKPLDFDESLAAEDYGCYGETEPKSGPDVEEDESKPPASLPLADVNVDRSDEDSEDEFERPSPPKVWRRRREQRLRVWVDVCLLDDELGIVVDWLVSGVDVPFCNGWLLA